MITVMVCWECMVTPKGQTAGTTCGDFYAQIPALEPAALESVRKHLHAEISRQYVGAEIAKPTFRSVLPMQDGGQIVKPRFGFGG